MSAEREALLRRLRAVAAEAYQEANDAATRAEVIAGRFGYDSPEAVEARAHRLALQEEAHVASKAVQFEIRRETWGHA